MKTTINDWLSAVEQTAQDHEEGRHVASLSSCRFCQLSRADRNEENFRYDYCDYCIHDVIAKELELDSSPAKHGIPCRVVVRAGYAPEFDAERNDFYDGKARASYLRDKVAPAVHRWFKDK